MKKTLQQAIKSAAYSLTKLALTQFCFLVLITNSAFAENSKTAHCNSKIAMTDARISATDPLSKNDKNGVLNVKINLEQTVSGTVKDEKGDAMPGVNVVIKGTSKGVQTDSEANLAFKRKWAMS